MSSETKPELEKKVEKKIEVKNFCSHMNLPKERQCPTMNDL
jgi:hypothetical protein